MTFLRLRRTESRNGNLKKRPEGCLNRARPEELTQRLNRSARTKDGILRGGGPTGLEFGSEELARVPALLAVCFTRFTRRLPEERLVTCTTRPRCPA